MDKRVIFAVAGSGKTTHIISQLSLEKRSLIITYTTNNIQNIRNAIIHKFGYFPNNIKLQSYFGFLHSFCFKPLLSYKYNSRGINWENPPQFTLRLKRTDDRFYLDRNKKLYFNRIAKLCEIQEILGDINKRIEKYFDCLFIDEIQDFAGHDFNLLKSITKVNCEILFVGDFYQHTFDTSKDGNVNIGLFDNYVSYKKKFEQMGLTVDVEKLKKSFRCSKTICDFIQNYLGIEISAVEDRESNFEIIDNAEDAKRIINDKSIIKLFYKESHKYECYSQNWGSSKGINSYNNVCVILNKTTREALAKGKLSELKSQTKNKLYVACSRANNDLYLISDEFTVKN